MSEIVITKSYCTVRFSSLDRATLLMEGEFHRTRSAFEIDVSGKYWSLAVGEIAPGLVSARCGSRRIPWAGLCAVFLPPCSIIQWDIGPGRFRYEALWTDHPLPSFVPRLGALFKPGGADLPRSAAAALEVIRGGSDFQPVVPDYAAHVVAIKAKRLIDSIYSEDFRFAEIAAQLRISPSMLTQYFRKSFGLSPGEYRTKLRLSNAAWNLLNGEKSASKVGLEVGITDHARFFHQFKRDKLLVPSAYKTAERVARTAKRVTRTAKQNPPERSR